MNERMISLEEIARLVNGVVKGDPQKRIANARSLSRAGENDIAYVAKGKSGTFPVLQAGALIVAKDAQIEHPNQVVVDEPKVAFARVLVLFYPRQKFTEGVHPTVIIGAGCRIDPSASIGPYCTLGQGVSIGPGSEIHAGVIVYNDVLIGADCLIYSRTVIREGTQIGNRVIVQPGAIIGSDGFGFGRDGEGKPVKIPQVGRVVIGDDCEIGANTCIDRSTLEETILENGVKLDNLIQIGHNVVIGEGTALSALTGISGSVTIGKGVQMGGQVGVADHVTIADGVMAVGRTGITGSVLQRMVVAGYPHEEVSRWRRNQAVARNLEKLHQRIKDLEQKIKELEEK